MSAEYFPASGNPASSFGDRQVEAWVDHEEYPDTMTTALDVTPEAATGFTVAEIAEAERYELPKYDEAPGD